MLSDALTPLFAEIHVAAPGHEGIQADASFHQHGAVLYAGGYGAAFTDDCTRWVEFTQGTRFAPSPEQIQLLERYVLDGQQWMVRGKIYDYGVVGREIVRARQGRPRPGGLRRAPGEAAGSAPEGTVRLCRSPSRRGVGAAARGQPPLLEVGLHGA